MARRPLATHRSRDGDAAARGRSGAYLGLRLRLLLLLFFVDRFVLICVQAYMCDVSLCTSVFSIGRRMDCQ